MDIGVLGGYRGCWVDIGVLGGYRDVGWIGALHWLHYVIPTRYHQRLHEVASASDVDVVVVRIV